MARGKRAHRISDLYLFKALSGVTAAPDGKLAAFVAAQPDMKSNKVRSEIWAWSEEGGASQATFDGKAGSPRFSPRGDRLAFLSDRVGEKPQVHVMAMGLSEGRRVTNFESGAVSFEWSRDGRRLAVVARADKTAKEKKRETDRLDWRTWGEDEPRQRLWIVSADGSGKPRCVSAPGEHVSIAAWAPDGKRLAYVSCPEASIDSQWFASELKVVGAGGRGRRTVCATQGHSIGSRMHFSADGREVLMVEAYGDRDLFHDAVKLVDLASGRKRFVAPRFDYRQFSPQWLSDGRVLFEAEQETTFTLNVCAVGGDPQRIVGGRGAAAFAAPAEKAGKVFFIYSEAARPDELHAAPLDGSGEPAALTALNGALGRVRLAPAEVVRWKSGPLDVEGVLYLPSKAGARKPYPLIVMPHGGPYGASLYSYGGAAVPNIFCAAGYACFLPNFRGSTGRGKAFARLNIRDWGDGPFADIMAGVDSLIRRGIIDGRRMAVFGGSYGGYMTCWAVGHTKRFRCAVAVAAVTNNVSMWGTTDIPSFQQYCSGKTPVSFSDAYWRDQSPLHHVGRVRTPTLVVTGEVDARVPPGQSHEFYRALKARGVETKLLLYPREPHGINEPRHRLHYFKTILDWINRYTLA